MSPIKENVNICESGYFPHSPGGEFGKSQSKFPSTEFGVCASLAPEQVENIHESLIPELGLKQKESLISPKRKIWKFDHFIICRLLALAFGQNGLKKIYKKLHLPYQGSSEAYKMHHTLVQMCIKPNPASRYVDMLRDILLS